MNSCSSIYFHQMNSHCFSLTYSRNMDNCYVIISRWWHSLRHSYYWTKTCTWDPGTEITTLCRPSVSVKAKKGKFISVQGQHMWALRWETWHFLRVLRLPLPIPFPSNTKFYIIHNPGMVKLAIYNLSTKIIRLTPKLRKIKSKFIHVLN
jgi:hypothetical protein